MSSTNCREQNIQKKRQLNVPSARGIYFIDTWKIILTIGSGVESFARRKAVVHRKSSPYDEAKHQSSSSAEEEAFFPDDNERRSSCTKECYDETYKSYCDCKLMGFGIIQKIPYCGQRSDPMDVTFSSACVRCGLCLVIADKINKTLMDVHDAMLPDRSLDTAEADALLGMICDESFARYRLREIEGERYIGESLPGSSLVESTANGLWVINLKNKCNELLEEICPSKLYKLWQEWRDDGMDNRNLATILCRGDVGILRDCRSIGDGSNLSDDQELFQAGVKVKAAFHCTS